MRRTQLIALLLVVIVAVAVTPAMAAKKAKGAETPIVGASRWPTLSAYCTPAYPYRYQTYTAWGWLSWWGHPLSNRYVQVYYRFSTTAGWHYLKSVKTDVNGRYSFSSWTSAVAVNWMIKFAGDSVYYPKTCYITVHTKISQCTHIDIIIYHHLGTPCNTCAAMNGELSYMVPMKYVTVSFQNGTNHVIGVVRETGYTQEFEWGNVGQMVVWIYNMLTCKA